MTVSLKDAMARATRDCMASPEEINNVQSRFLEKTKCPQCQEAMKRFPPGVWQCVNRKCKNLTAYIRKTDARE